jgi:hypothetical protein
LLRLILIVRYLLHITSVCPLWSYNSHNIRVNITFQIYVQYIELLFGQFLIEITVLSLSVFYHVKAIIVTDQVLACPFVIGGRR